MGSGSPQRGGSYIAAQDQAKEAITEFYAKQSCECREVDRRRDPRFGYRAVHLIVRIDGIPVEIQVRTALQDTWAQIVERLADQWGRGIRYGQEPELPDSLVRSDDFVVSRREAMNTLMSLSDAIAETEQLRRRADSVESKRRQLDAAWHAAVSSPADPESMVDKAPTELSGDLQEIAKFMAEHSEDLDDDDLILPSAEEGLTWAHVSQMIKTSLVLLGREVDTMSAELSVDEQRLRDRLRLIAEATDEEGDQ